MFSDPVIGENFLGRSDILALLEKRTAGLKDGYRQNIAILGPKFIGKTSCIFQFLSLLNDNQIIPIYLEIKPQSFVQFAHRFIGVLLYYFLQFKGLEVKEDLNFLIKKSKEYIPKTIERMERIESDLGKAKLDEAYLGLLELTAIIREETRNFCIIILDEFHNLSNLRLKNPFLELGKKIMVQKETMYIITSSSVNIAKRILAEKFSLLFGNFEIVELEPFDSKTAQHFFQQRLQGLSIPQDLESFLVAFTGGHPLYLDIICLELLKIASTLRLSDISSKLIGQSLESLIFSSHGALNQYFINYISCLSNGRSWPIFNSLLTSITKNNKLRDIAKSTGRQGKDILKQINRLIDLDIVSRYGSFYKLSDRIFNFWLKSVYTRREAQLVPDIYRQSERFKEDIENIICAFISESKKELSERIIDLFKVFKNETVYIEGKRYILPSFSEVKQKYTDENNFYIIAHSPKINWICAFKKGEVSEGDCIKFISDYKQLRLKNYRKILIVLDGIEINAGLLAKEEKIWIWNLSNLNLFLELYGRHQIVS